MFSVLREQKLFRAFWVASLISQTGDRMHNLALILYVYSRSGSAAALGQFLSYSAVTSLLAGPIFAVFVDRLRPKRTLVIVDLLRAIVVGSIPFIPGLTGVYLAAALLAALDVLYSPAYHKVFPRLVSGDKLLAANSVTATSDRFIQIIVPSIGGVLISAFGAAFAFLLNAASFVVSALIVATIPVEDPLVEVRSKEDRRKALWGEFREGLNLTLRSRTFIAMLVIQTVAVLVVSVNNALVMPFISQVMKLGAREYGYLSSALAAGLLGGALLIGTMRSRLSAFRLLPFGIGLIGLAVLSFAFARSLPTVLVMRVVLGFGLAVYGVTFQTSMQQAAPDRIRGRVFALFRSASDMMSTVTLGLAGVIAGVISIPLMFGLVGAFATLAAGGGLVLMKTKGWNQSANAAVGDSK
jgi:MFS transporter, DHA3 family, macrolide efflux protein